MERSLYKMVFHGAKRGTWSALMTVPEVKKIKKSNMINAMKARETVRCMRKHDDCAAAEAVLGKVHRCRNNT